MFNNNGFINEIKFNIYLVEMPKNTYNSYIPSVTLNITLKVDKSKKEKENYILDQ